MAKPKLYISSTFFDLEEHRRVLIDVLDKTGCFDLSVMERNGTQDESPLTVSLQGIVDTEFYILLLGNRYGFIPEGGTLSITNQEYKLAIGDQTPGVAGKPDRKKCVLPFFIDGNYLYPDNIVEKVNAEEKNDGPELTKHKNNLLKQLKGSIEKEFVLDARFTSPADLGAKVMSALIPAMVRRGHISLVKELKLTDQILYRCNRDLAREEFLERNFYWKKFYRVFVIHGIDEEKLEYFSNNLEYYDLNSWKNSLEINMDSYRSIGPEKFLPMMIRKIHKHLFGELPASEDMSFDELTDKIIATEGNTDKVIKFEISYEAWKERYDELLVVFFDAIAAANDRLKAWESTANEASLLNKSKVFHILMNIKYMSIKEEIRQRHAAFVKLERLNNVHVSHIKEWVRTHFVTNKDRLLPNQVEDIATRIATYYFSAYIKPDKPFTMTEATERLDKILFDFNENQNLFADYQNLFRI